MTKTIIFDFGNVIGFFDHQIAIDKLKPFTPLSSEEIRKRVYEGNLEDDYEKGRMTTAEFARTVLKICEIDRSPEQYLEAFVNIFQVNPDVVQWLPALKRHYRLMLASNTNEAHAEHFKIQFAEYLKYFDFLGLSFEAKARKPSTTFYHYVQNRAECDVSECLFIDDLPANVEAAEAFGWQGIVYSKGSRLAELLSVRGILLQ